MYRVNKYEDLEEELKQLLLKIEDLEKQKWDLENQLIEEDGDWLYSMVREELLEEDLKLRKKLDDLEQGLYKLNKDLKPTLLVMEKELNVVTEEVKKDREIIEALYDKLQETRKAFQITKESLADQLNLELDAEELNDFVQETPEEAADLDKDISNLRVRIEEDVSVKSMNDGKTS